MSSPGEQKKIQCMIEKDNPQKKVQKRWLKLDSTGFSYYDPDYKENRKGQILFSEIQDIKNGQGLYFVIVAHTQKEIKKKKPPRTFTFKADKESNKARIVTLLCEFTKKPLPQGMMVSSETSESTPRLVDPPKVPKTPPPNLPMKPKDSLYVWAHLDSNNKPTLYDPLSTELIEEAFRQGDAELLLNHGEFFSKNPFKVLLKGLGPLIYAQVRLSNGNQRVVKRYPLNYSPEPFRWYWEDKIKKEGLIERKEWKPYDDFTQCLIESAFLENPNGSIILDHNDFFQKTPRKIQFKPPTQINTQTNKKRPVKREPPTPSGLVIQLPPRPRPPITHIETPKLEKDKSVRDSEKLKSETDLISSSATTTINPVPKKAFTRKDRLFCRITDRQHFIQAYRDLMQKQFDHPPVPFQLGGIFLRYHPPLPVPPPGYERGWTVLKELEGGAGGGKGEVRATEPDKLVIRSVEELVSDNPDDRTFALFHVMVNCVVIRCLADGRWVLLVAEGDDPYSGLSFKMASFLEQTFPFAERPLIPESLRIRLQSMELRVDQGEHLQQLYFVIQEIVKHFDEALFSLGTYALSLEEKTDVGNTKSYVELGNLVLNRLCVILSFIFADGFNKGWLFWTNYNPWDFVKAAATQHNGEYAPARTLQELQIATSVARIDISTNEPSKKLLSFFCEALMERSLGVWVSVLHSNSFELENWYYKESLLHRAGLEIVQILQSLDGLPFNLDFSSLASTTSVPASDVASGTVAVAGVVSNTT